MTTLRRIGLALAALGAVAGCTGTADTFPLNDAAKNLGPIKVTYMKTGIGSGPVTITMADGEVLSRLRKNRELRGG